MTAAGVTPTATFCATLVDEWVRAGVGAAFVAPGSRSTPLALALADRSEIRLEVFLDERSASFAAIGWARQREFPAVILSSSGTAAAHFHAAVIEADLSAVPLIVCTADRPPELWDVGAPQTIDQTHLFGRAVRWYGEPGVPDPALGTTWRSWGTRAVAEATGWSGRPGPVHLNLSFRDPLAGEPGVLPEGRAGGLPWHVAKVAPDDSESAESAGDPSLLAAWSDQRVVVIAGSGVRHPLTLLEAAETLGWPVIADHRSGCRGDGSIGHADALVRVESFVAEHQPSLIIRLGESLSSKVLNQWIERMADTGSHLLLGTPDGRWLDPERRAGHVLPEPVVSASIQALAAERSGATSDRAWIEGWRNADRLAASTIADLLDRSDSVTDPGVVRSVVTDLPPHAALVVASSMAVRELEWYGPARTDVSVHANRGANGIDGTVATAIGVAATGTPTVCVTGDVAFVHDATSLAALARRDIDLTIVVLDNDGSGIFNFLPQRDLVDPDRFELLFGTPHGTDLRALARAHGLDAQVWSGSPGPIDGVRVIAATTDRSRTVDLHDELNRAVAHAVEGR